MSIQNDVDHCLEKLKTARVEMLMKFPFFGIIAQRLRYIEDNERVDTAGVDGKNMYWNRDFIKSLEKEEVLFLLSHEILHLVYDHLGRKGNRNHALLNMAQDYLINYVLVMEGVGNMPLCGLYDKRFNNSLTSEQIYDILEKENTPIQDTLDKHLDLEGMSHEARESLRNEIKGIVVQAAMSAKMAGKLSAGLSRLIDDLVETKIPWTRYVNKTIQSLKKDKYGYSRPSRRQQSQLKRSNFVFPARLPGKTVNIAISFDLSGSIGEKEARVFLSETVSMMSIFKHFTLTLWTFDTEPHNPKVFTERNRRDIMNYDFKGGGGSCFNSSVEFMKNPKEFGFDLKPFKPDQLFVFTDMALSGFGDPNYCPTNWISYGGGNAPAPYGKLIKYEEI